MAKTGRSTRVDSESQVESSRLDYNYATQLDLADSTANTTAEGNYGLAPLPLSYQHSLWMAPEAVITTAIAIEAVRTVRQDVIGPLFVVVVDCKMISLSQFSYLHWRN